MVVASFRGTDSYGLFTYTPLGEYKYEKYRIEKNTGSSAEFIMADRRRPLKQKMIRTNWTEVFMGHARDATVGRVSRSNAHPFSTGRYISCHNGTLKDPEFRDTKSNKTDSQLMFEKMESDGIVPVLSSLSHDSAYAVSIFDKTDSSVTLARNNRRPLFIGIEKTGGSVFYASELSMLHLVASRKRGWSDDKVEMDFFELEPNRAYKISLKEIRKGNITPWETVKWSATKAPVRKVLLDDFDTDLWNDGSLLGDSDSCSDCGQILSSVDMMKATHFKIGSSKITTCRECVQSALKSGPKMN